MNEELSDLITKAKAMIDAREFDACEALLATAMFQNPHSAVPHNLMGLLLEKKRRHEDAMKHFRASNALDPAYAPGTGTPVSGGPSSAKILSVIRKLGPLRFKGADVVEVAPAYDHADITAIAGATVAMYMLGLHAEELAEREPVA